MAFAERGRARDHRHPVVRACVLRPEEADCTVRPVRCVIYTRKSSDEGLEQGFNSLDAQREACAAYNRRPRAERCADPSGRAGLSAVGYPALRADRHHPAGRART